MEWLTYYYKALTLQMQKFKFVVINFVSLKLQEMFIIKIYKNIIFINTGVL